MKKSFFIIGFLALQATTALAWDFPRIPNIPWIPIPHINYSCTLTTGGFFSPYYGRGSSEAGARADAINSCERHESSESCERGTMADCRPTSVVP